MPLIESLCDFLKSTKDLLSIDVSWNHMPPESGKLFFEALKNCHMLKHLNYSYNYIRYNYDKEEENCLEEILSFLANSKQILHVNFSSVKMRPDDITTILTEIRNHECLLSMHLTSNIYPDREEVVNILEAEIWRNTYTYNDYSGMKDVRSVQMQKISKFSFPLTFNPV